MAMLCCYYSAQENNNLVTLKGHWQFPVKSKELPKWETWEVQRVRYMHDPQLGQSGKENRICWREQAPSFSPCQQYMHSEHSDSCVGVHWGTRWGQDKNVFARICSRLQPSLPEEPPERSQMWIYLITASSEVARRIVHCTSFLHFKL